MKLSIALGMLALSTPLLGCIADVDVTGGDGSQAGVSAELFGGSQLFSKETFGGNGRTCRTCHGEFSGTISPQQVSSLLSRYPSSPLFLFDGSDDGAGHGTSRISARATIRITIPLPPGVHILENPSATTVTFNRGIPSTLNTPALDPVLMLDGRAPSLTAQALDAIDGHAQASIEPTASQLQAIAAFEKSDEFFSSPKLRNYARGGSAPVLPPGTTASEIRGRRFFVDAPINIDPATGLKVLDGICAQCHSGPMLNTGNGTNPNIPAGARFSTARVSSFNVLGNPVYNFVFPNADGTTTTVATSDPGCILIPSTNCASIGPVPLASKAKFGFFKTPMLWGVARTAPYFHDNSALTLDEVVDQYRRFFTQSGGITPISDQDKADMVAYMMLLK